ncbi:MAG TPA: DUF366 family protein [Planctomycetes bacterium]|nr:DUF366 family protein [Planctomycetota bacterium]
MVERQGTQSVALIRPATFLSDDRLTYDGTQLRSHWILETFGLRGDAIVGFEGPADVRDGHLVDLDDRSRGLFIAGAAMRHFIVESFGPDLDRGVFLQRLLVLLVREILAEKGISDVRRSGDDLFVGDGKLTVSIATVSPVSCLVHLGVNVTSEGTPVRTANLTDLGLDPRGFAESLIARFADEIDGMACATGKVQGVS